jgi:CRP-like cAMP-binding protein
MQMDVIQQVALFRGMDEAELAAALSALSAKEKTYEKDETILYAGNVSEHMGLVLEGSVTIESNDVWGNRTILSHIEKGGTFAETYALLEDEPMLVDVIANEKSNILFLRIGSLNLLQQDISPWRVKLIGNLLRISSQKNLHLSGRSFHTAPKSIRGRVMAYLNSVSLQKNKIDFDIPFDRQQLADYLNVERSALSRELSNMQQDGLIIVRRNHFEIAKNE